METATSQLRALRTRHEVPTRATAAAITTTQTQPPTRVQPQAASLAALLRLRAVVELLSIASNTVREREGERLRVRAGMCACACVCGHNNYCHFIILFSLCVFLMNRSPTKRAALLRRCRRRCRHRCMFCRRTCAQFGLSASASVRASACEH